MLTVGYLNYSGYIIILVSFRFLLFVHHPFQLPKLGASRPATPVYLQFSND